MDYEQALATIAQAVSNLAALEERVAQVRLERDLKAAELERLREELESRNTQKTLEFASLSSSFAFVPLSGDMTEDAIRDDERAKMKKAIRMHLPDHIARYVGEVIDRESR